MKWSFRLNLIDLLLERLTQWRETEEKRITRQELKRLSTIGLSVEPSIDGYEIKNIQRSHLVELCHHLHTLKQLGQGSLFAEQLEELGRNAVFQNMERRN